MRPRIVLHEGHLFDVIDEVGVPLVELREAAWDVVSVSCHDPFLLIKMLSVYYGLLHGPESAEGVPGKGQLLGYYQGCKPIFIKVEPV